MKEKKGKDFCTIENLKEYNLPTKIYLNKIPFSKNVLQDSIYKNIFLDKKELEKS